MRLLRTIPARLALIIAVLACVGSGGGGRAGPAVAHAAFGGASPPSQPPSPPCPFGFTSSIGPTGTVHCEPTEGSTVRYGILPRAGINGEGTGAGVSYSGEPGQEDSSPPFPLPLPPSTAADETARTARARVEDDLCPLGSWCDSEGRRHACPPGRAGTLRGEARPACAVPCLGGFRCPSGSVSPRELPCATADEDADKVFCPAGSSVPAPVSRGFYAVGSGDGTSLPASRTRTAQSRCPAGSFCGSGVAAPCPPGRFASSPGQWQSLCEGPCSRGYFCGPGAVLPTETECGGPDRFCAPGSAEPQRAADGFYTVRLHDDDVGAGLTPDGVLLVSARAAAAADASPSTSTTRDAQVECAPGSFCRDGQRSLCPGGRFGNRTRETDPLCAGPCSAGFFCPPGSTGPEERVCGDASVYCPPGSPAPRLVSAGHFSVSARPVLASIIVEGDPSASTSAAADGSLLPSVAAPASYVDVRPLLGSAAGGETGWDGAEAVLDPFAAAVDSSRRTAEVQCPRGTYCVGGMALLCPGGTWGPSTGLADVLGCLPCEAGFRCPPGSVSPRQHLCGNETVFCPARSAAPHGVTDGFYTAGGLTTARPGGRTPSLPDAESGEEPMVCDGNLTLHLDLHGPPAARAEFPVSDCVADGHARGVSADARYASEDESDVGTGDALLLLLVRLARTALLVPSTRLLPSRLDETAGAAALPSLPDPQAVRAEGTLLVTPPVPREPCQVPRSPLLGPLTPTRVRWRACIGPLLGDSDTRATQIRCEPGTFCWLGLRLLCPPGRVGTRAGETDWLCAASCPPGHFCGWGSTEPTPCGRPDLYCPAASGAPTPVDVGHYSDPNEPLDRRSSQHICPPGSYCSGGLRVPCPEGTFGGAFGLSSPESCPPCAAGHYCPVGSSSPTQMRCGERDGLGPRAYCPPGSARPLLVSPGYYTVGGFELTRGLPENTTRTMQVRCEPGHYCLAGVRRECPAGRFASNPGSTSCDAPCAPGHFCPPGSVASTEFRCGDVYLFLVDVLGAIAAQSSIQSHPFNNSDAVPLLHPAYDYRALYALYAELAGGGAVAGGVGGAGATGAWRVTVRALDAMDDFLPLGNTTAWGENATTLAGVAFLNGSFTPTGEPDPNLPIPCGPGSNRTDCSVVARDAELAGLLDPSQLNATRSSSSSSSAAAASSRLLRAADGSVILQLTAIGPVNWTVNYTANPSGGGSTGGGYGLRPDAGNATTLNYTVTVRWRNGVRFRLPPVIAPLPSFAATMRHVLQGGPDAVYCPAGTGWPLPVPLGHGSNTTADALAAALASLYPNASAVPPPTPPIFPSHPLPALLGRLVNETRDTTYPAPPGTYAVAGIVRPCPPGRVGSRSGETRRECEAWCPAGFACPEGTAKPIPCEDGWYAPAGFAACVACPGGGGGGMGAEGVVPQPAAGGTGVEPDSQAAAASSYAAQEEAYERPEGTLNGARVAPDLVPLLPGGGGDGTGGGRATGSLPASPPLVRCRNARYCCAMGP
jgi:hypothetical protein